MSNFAANQQAGFGALGAPATPNVHSPQVLLPPSSQLPAMLTSFPSINAGGGSHHGALPSSAGGAAYPYGLGPSMGAAFNTPGMGGNMAAPAFNWSSVPAQWMPQVSLPDAGALAHMTAQRYAGTLQPAQQAGGGGAPWMGAVAGAAPPLPPRQPALPSMQQLSHMGVLPSAGGPRHGAEAIAAAMPSGPLSHAHAGHSQAMVSRGSGSGSVRMADTESAPPPWAAWAADATLHVGVPDSSCLWVVTMAISKDMVALTIAQVDDGLGRLAPGTELEALLLVSMTQSKARTLGAASRTQSMRTLIFVLSTPRETFDHHIKDQDEAVRTTLLAAVGNTSCYGARWRTCSRLVDAEYAKQLASAAAQTASRFCATTARSPTVSASCPGIVCIHGMGVAEPRLLVCDAAASAGQLWCAVEAHLLAAGADWVAATVCVFLVGAAADGGRLVPLVEQSETAGLPWTTCTAADGAFSMPLLHLYQQSWVSVVSAEGRGVSTASMRAILCDPLPGASCFTALLSQQGDYDGNMQGLRVGGVLADGRGVVVLEWAAAALPAAARRGALQTLVDKARDVSDFAVCQLAVHFDGQRLPLWFSRKQTMDEVLRCLLMHFDLDEENTKCRLYADGGSPAGGAARTEQPYTNTSTLEDLFPDGSGRLTLESGTLVCGCSCWVVGTEMQ